MSTFHVRLKEAISSKGTAVCLGLDPHPGQFPPCLQALLAQRGAGEGLAQWAQQLLEIAAPLVPAVKFQSACFEALGWQGWRCLTEVAESAGRLGLLTIFDGKRGDIASTMHAYGVAVFEQLAMDVMTVQPYLGLEVITALKPWLHKGKGIYLVWMTSNPTHQLIQLYQGVNARTLSEDLLSAFSALLLREGLLASCGVVLGATRLSSLPAPILSQAEGFPLLLPGLGEQGGDLGKCAERLLRPGAGHLFPLSRSLSGLGSSQWQEVMASFSLQEYFTWFENNLRATAPRFSP